MRNITFAYFVDNKFIGWWGGTFGNISKCPKLYSNTPNQIEVIKNNFIHKLTKIENSSFDVEKEKVKGLAALSLATFDGEEKLRGKDVSLRIVECPYYDGLNPDFNEEEYERLMSEYKRDFDEASKHLGDFPSRARTEFVAKYNLTHPKPECNNWVYADYEKVKEWASEEPTSFIGEINKAECLS